MKAGEEREEKKNKMSVRPQKMCHYILDIPICNNLVIHNQCAYAIKLPQSTNNVCSRHSDRTLEPIVCTRYYMWITLIILINSE